MPAPPLDGQPESLSQVPREARRAYMARVAGDTSVPWWTAVVLTASSQLQARRYEAEIARRRNEGKLPRGVLYLAVPDLDDQRIGSGGATLHALRVLAERTLAAAHASSLEEWWRTQRVLMVHSGGDSRRLPEYSLSGKLFSALPVRLPWGEPSTVFDQTMVLSTPWCARLSAGLLVAAGDVILTFDAAQLNWSRGGVCGVAMRQPLETGSKHGVYILNEQGRVYSFLQKPSPEEMRRAGGVLSGERCALDIGLLCFDASVAAQLTALAGVTRTGGRWTFGPGLLTRKDGNLPVIDLYEHVTGFLASVTGPGRRDQPALSELELALRGIPFWCSLVDGDFTHVGTTWQFRELMTTETPFLRLYGAHTRAGVADPPGVRSAGVIIDSVLAAGSVLEPGALAIECECAYPLRIGSGGIAHGLNGVDAPVEIPEDTVAHQTHVQLPNGLQGAVIRVFGVHDDPKAPVEGERATWLGRPILDVLRCMGADPDEVWPEVAVPDRSLWNARLFACENPGRAWDCARWWLGYSGGYSLADWRGATRLSLATSSQWADAEALAAARVRRNQAHWTLTARQLAQGGTDLRPLLAHAPGIEPLAETGRALAADAASLEDGELTESASRHFQASLFLRQAGLEEEADHERALAFRCVRKAVDAGAASADAQPVETWRHRQVEVSAPPRIDFGGGWSDTPPFCLDWGGTVLNMAIEVNGGYPIRTMVRRLQEPLIRCHAAGEGQAEEYRTTEAILAQPGPGSPYAIPRAALQVAGVIRPGDDLRKRLESLGGGLDIVTEVNLPMGSGLGTSSILAATLIESLLQMAGISLARHELSDQVMRLEQLMTTGGGWQDQAGGIFPGAKLITSGPGFRQRLRVEPLGWTAEQQREFTAHFVFYYTGIQRIARNLLAQVVGSYLSREVATVQVLHSIKTLAVEMSYAMREGDWDYLGRLMDRHWELNKVLDPNTTNAPINGLLRELKPLLAGAKLAGAGGGGFLMMVARDPDRAAELRRRLSVSTESLPGTLYRMAIAQDGLRVVRQ